MSFHPYLETLRRPVCDIRPSARRRPAPPPTIIHLCTTADRAQAFLVSGDLTRIQILCLYAMLPESAIAFPSIAKRWKLAHVLADPGWAAAHCQEQSPPPSSLTFTL